MDIEKVKALAVRPGPSGRFYERVSTGQPVTIQADTAWSIFNRLTREEVILYLDARKVQGFNVILGVLLSELDVRAADGVILGPDGSRVADTSDEGEGPKSWLYPNRYGHLPLLNDNPSTPNPEYFEHVDWVVNAAADRGILVGLVPSWARFVNKGWTFGPVLFNETSARSYGRFLGERYQFLPKLLGGDSNPHWLETGGMEIWKRLGAYMQAGATGPLPRVDDIPRAETYALWDAMAEGIMKAESPAWGGGKPMITYHPTALWLPTGPPALASAYFGDREWLAMDGCQSGHADYPNVKVEPALEYWDARAGHVPLGHAWSHKTVRPIIDLEPHYEGMRNGIMGPSEKIWDADDVRAGAWQSMLSGACGVVYGANVMWQMFDPARAAEDKRHTPVCGLDGKTGWKDALSSPGPSQVQICTSFFDSLPPDMFHARRPAQELLVENEAPEEWTERDARVDLAICEVKGSTKMLLAHSGYGYGFTLDMSKCAFAGEVSAEWLNPRTGKTAPAGKVQSGRQRFEPPSKGSVKEDWVLVLQSK